jgi:hypothetical protein
MHKKWKQILLCTINNQPITGIKNDDRPWKVLSTGRFLDSRMQSIQRKLPIKHRLLSDLMKYTIR